jgi:hypothetical protein
MNVHHIKIKKGKERNKFLKNGSPDDLARIISNWLEFGYHDKESIGMQLGVECGAVA